MLPQLWPGVAPGAPHRELRTEGTPSAVTGRTVQEVASMPIPTTWRQHRAAREHGRIPASSTSCSRPGPEAPSRAEGAHPSPVTCHQSRHGDKRVRRGPALRRSAGLAAVRAEAVPKSTPMAYACEVICEMLALSNTQRPPSIADVATLPESPIKPFRGSEQPPQRAPGD